MGIHIGRSFGQSLKPGHAVSYLIQPLPVGLDECVGTGQHEVVINQCTTGTFEMIFLCGNETYILLQNLATVEIAMDVWSSRGGEHCNTIRSLCPMPRPISQETTKAGLASYLPQKLRF